MGSRLEARLRRVEAAQDGNQQMHVVEGHSDAEHRAKIDELIRTGKTRDTDMFVKIMQYAEPETAPEPR